MSKPRLLDLFCGAGGAAMGYHQAGFDVVGVDIKPQPRYPFDFIQADALTADVGGFDVIHASPPCQRYSQATIFHAGRQEQHPDLVAPIRVLLRSAGVPYVIENVPGAPLVNPVMLCGTMFEGLKVYRHRLFETEPPLYFPPYHNPHLHRAAYGNTKLDEHGWMTVVGHFGNKAAARVAMGIDWMTQGELAEAIPPAYTKWIGEQLMKVLKAAA